MTFYENAYICDSVKKITGTNRKKVVNFNIIILWVIRNMICDNLSLFTL